MNRYPYTDMHEMNLDWILLKVKEMIGEWDTTKNAWNELHEFVDNYFENLDVQQEINNKLDEMAEGGELLDLMKPYVDEKLPLAVADQIADVVALQIGTVVASQLPDVVSAQLPGIAATAAAAEVSDWLEAHVDPDTGYVIDDSLTVTDAAADAKVTGAIRTSLYEYSLTGDIEWAADNLAHYVKNDGTVASSNGYRCSDYVEVPEFAKSVTIGNEFDILGITYHLTPGVVFFDDAQSVIGYGSGQTTQTATYAIPSGTKYVRFNQPNTSNANVSDATCGFNWNYELNDILKEISGSYSFSLTFTESGQTINTGVKAKAGTTYTARLTSSYSPSPSDREESQINMFSNGNYSNYARIFEDTTATDLPCDADGALCFYNSGSFIGSVSVTVSCNVKRAMEHTPPVYRVGHYESNKSLTKLLLQLKDDDSEKIIMINSGDYDIFDEYKDLQDSGDLPTVPDSDYDPSTGYVPYCVFVPDNTHIIGEGRVRLYYSPDPEDTTVNEAATLSPINVAGSMTLENVEIYVKNGRYCIHDDPIRDSRYNGSRKFYKNVKCVKEISDLYDETHSYGTPHCLGCGVSRAMYYEFDNCYFETKSASSASRTLYFHDRAIVGGVTLNDAMSSRIVIKNTIIKSGSGNLAVFLGNIGAGLDIRVNVDSSWTNGKIVSADESNWQTGTNPNSFELYVLKSTYDELIVRDSGNTYEPVVCS